MGHDAARATDTITGDGGGGGGGGSSGGGYKGRFLFSFFLSVTGNGVRCRLHGKPNNISYVGENDYDGRDREEAAAAAAVVVTRVRVLTPARERGKSRRPFLRYNRNRFDGRVGERMSERDGACACARVCVRVCGVGRKPVLVRRGTDRRHTRHAHARHSATTWTGAGACSVRERVVVVRGITAGGGARRRGADPDNLFASVYGVCGWLRACCSRRRVKSTVHGFFEYLLRRDGYNIRRHQNRRDGIARPNPPHGRPRRIFFDFRRSTIVCAFSFSIRFIIRA